MLNFATIQKPVSSHSNSSSSLKFIDFIRSHAAHPYTDHKLLNNFSFPWCLHTTHTSPLDLFRVIELFVKATTSSSTTSETAASFHLNQDMVKFVHNIEDQLLEDTVWREDSTLWTGLSRIKLNTNFTEKQQQLRLLPSSKFAIPLNDELYHHLSTNNNSMKSVTNRYANSSPLGNTTVHSANQSANDGQLLVSSPVKQPTITRVVCSNNQTNTIQVSSIIILSLFILPGMVFLPDILFLGEKTR
jgi:hypothetical protein